MLLNNKHTPEGSEDQNNSNEQNSQEVQEPQNYQQNGSNVQEEEEEEPQREITQTDHLNRRLLDSFLERLNQPNSSIPQTDPIDCSSEDFDPEASDPATDSDPLPQNPEA